MSQNACVYLEFVLVAKDAIANGLSTKTLSQRHRNQIWRGKIKTKRKYGKLFAFLHRCVCISYFDDFHANSVECSSCQSKQAKITEIGAFLESAHTCTQAA